MIIYDFFEACQNRIEMHPVNCLAEKREGLKSTRTFKPALGTGQDVLAENAEQETIEFTLTWENDPPCHFAYAYDSKSDLQPGLVDMPDMGKKLKGKSLFNRQFQYLSADRNSPKSSYDVSDYYIRDLNSLGNHGEYSAAGSVPSQPIPGSSFLLKPIQTIFSMASASLFGKTSFHPVTSRYFIWKEAPPPQRTLVPAWQSRSGQAGDLNGSVRVLLFAEADGNFIEDCDI